jgi:hypothetical protein
MFPQGLYGMNLTGMWMDEQYDSFDQRAEFKLVFLLWPRRCEITGKRLWLTHAYKGTCVRTGHGEPVEEHRYYDEVEFIIRKLKA